MADPTPPDNIAPDAAPPVGPDGGPDEDGALFRRLQAWTRSSRTHLSDWRTEAKLCYDFYSNEQWTTDEKKQFSDDERVAPVFNLIAVNVDAVCGLEVNNRQDVSYLPRTQGDVKVNDLLSSAAMWVRDTAQSEDEESDAFQDTVICGLGATETWKPDAETIAVDRRDPLEMIYDTSAKKPNLVDRRFGGRICEIDTDEALEMFRRYVKDENGQDTEEPIADELQFTVETINAKWATDLGGTSDGGKAFKKDYPDQTRAGIGGSAPVRPKKVTIVQIEWFDWEAGKKVYKQAFLGASTVLEVNPQEEWRFNFITGKRDRNKNIWYGIVRLLLDPQRMINKFLATLTHILATNAKGGLLYEDGVFADIREAEQDWSNPQKNIRVTQGALTRNAIQPRVAPPLPVGAVQLIEFAMTNIRNISGINVELLGAADREQAASLELQRRQSAVTILAKIFDAKRRYHKEQGKTLLSLMKTLPPETLVRITVDQPPQAQPPQIPPGTPPEQAQQIMQQFQQQQGQADAAKKQERFVQFQTVAQAFSDPSLKYDVIVDEAPSSPNQKEATWITLTQLINQGLQLPPKALAEALMYSPLPATVAEKMAEAIAGEPSQKEQELGQQLTQTSQALQESNQKLQDTQNQLEGTKLDKQADIINAHANDKKAEADLFRAKVDGLSKAGAMPMGEDAVPITDAIAKTMQDVQTIGQALSDLGQQVAQLQRGLGER